MGRAGGSVNGRRSRTGMHAAIVALVGTWTATTSASDVAAAGETPSLTTHEFGIFAPAFAFTAAADIRPLSFLSVGVGGCFGAPFGDIGLGVLARLRVYPFGEIANRPYISINGTSTVALGPEGGERGAGLLDVRLGTEWIDVAILPASIFVEGGFAVRHTLATELPVPVLNLGARFRQ